MAEEKMIIRVVIIKRETIKPSSPTPAHLKTFKLSTLDQLAPPVYVPMLFFYPNNQATSSDQRSHNLKKSLSESLARFYPIAGTILNNSTIDCNDEGAQYIEARYNGLLSTFLEQPTDISVVQEFVPAAIESPLQATTWPLLLAQATLFDCGGLALGLSVSHKFADATTIGIFMKSWAATCAGSDNKTVVGAVLDGTSSFFPQIDLSGFQPPPVEIKKVESVTKRYVFDKPNIENLKAQITVAVDDDSQIHNRQPSRVEVVTAIIWKCVVAASRANLGPPRFALARSMNIRRRAEPPLPENLVGNFVAIIASRIDEHEPELQDLASELRRGLRDFGDKRAKGLRGDAALEVIFHGLKEFSEFTGKDDTEGLFVTSMCNFQLYETVEFGWGKPIWVTIPFVTGHNNVVTLTDSRDGGVEAWVTLSKQDMASFECDPEILQFSH